MIGWDIIFGGITGLFGTALTEIFKYRNQKLQFDHDTKMVALETAAMKEESKMKIAVTKAEIEGAVELTDAEAYKKSLESGSKTIFSEKWIDRLFNVEGKFGKFFAIPVAVFIAFGFAFVEWLRSFMRPALTLYLTGMSSVITYMAWKLINVEGMAMTTTQAVNIYNESTSIIIYLTVSCVTWWFGDRTMAKSIVRMKNPKLDGDI